MRLLERVARLCEPGRVRVYPRAVFAMFFALWIGSYALMRESAILDGWGRFLGNDFMAFYTGAKLWMAGAPDLYDLDTQADLQIAMAGREISSVIPFISPPPALWLYLPFAQGGYLSGLAAWWALQLSAALCAAALLRRSIPGLAQRLSAAQMATICLCTMPTLLWLSYAQATGLALLIWVGTLALLLRGRDAAAGVTLALLAFKPQLALGPALLMLGGRRWRALAAGALTLALIGAASLWRFGPANAAWLAHGPEFAQMLGAQGYARWGVVSAYGFWNLALGPLSQRAADAMTGLTTLALLGAIAALWWRAPWRPDSAAWRARSAITLALASLAGLHLFLYDAMLWLIPLLLVLPDLESHDPDAPYLDGGPILAWSGLLFWALFLAEQLVSAQLGALGSLGLPPCALQPTTPLVIGWCWAVARHMRRVEAG